MRRTLLLSLVVVGAAVALAVGSYSALAGTGPVTSVASAVIGADEPDDGDVVEDADDVDAEDDDDVDGDDDDAEDDDDVDGDDVDAEDGDDVDAEDDGVGNNGEGAQHIAEVIEGTFDAEPGSVMALHEQGIGFGALFKLYALAAATGTSVEDLLATIPTNGDGGYEFGFGELRKALTPEEQAVLESGPKNLGQIVSASHRPEHAGADGGGGASAAHPSNGHGPPEGVPTNGDGEDDGDGPPEHAPAHGRN